MLLDNKNDIMNIEEAYLCGNSFSSLYKGYKDYEILMPEIKNDKEALLTDIMMLDFYINDLYLYILNHPNDDDVKNIMNNYIEEYNKSVCLYNKTYGKIDYQMGGAYV